MVRPWTTGFLEVGIKAVSALQPLHDRRACLRPSALILDLMPLPTMASTKVLHYLGLLLDRHDTRCCLSSTCICYTGCFRPGGLLWCSVYIKSRNMIVLTLPQILSLLKALDQYTPLEPSR